MAIARDLDTELVQPANDINPMDSTGEMKRLNGLGVIRGTPDPLRPVTAQLISPSMILQRVAASITPPAVLICSLIGCAQATVDRRAPRPV